MVGVVMTYYCERYSYIGIPSIGRTILYQKAEEEITILENFNVRFESTDLCSGLYTVFTLFLDSEPGFISVP